MFLLGKKKRKKEGWKLWQIGAIGLAIAFAVGGGGHKLLSKVPSLPSSIQAVHPEGTQSCAGLENLWVRAGGPSSDAFMAAEIARAESGGEQYSRDPASGTYTDGTVDYGLWQINSGSGGSPADYDELTNARAAVGLFERRGWEPWVTWQHGKEIGQC